jgi:hypothetical protein
MNDHSSFLLLFLLYSPGYREITSLDMITRLLRVTITLLYKYNSKLYKNNTDVFKNDKKKIKKTLVI